MPHAYDLTTRRRMLISLAALPLVSGCGAFRPDAFASPAGMRDASGADFNAINIYARYAGAAYRTDDEIRDAFPQTIRIQSTRRDGARYFLEVSPAPRTQTISVRGTRSWADRLHDIEFRLVEELAAEAAFHRGFDRDARLIYDDVTPFLRPGYRTRVTGHSLGAAVSAILMIYLLRDGYDVQPSINFGQPKFTNAAGAELYADLPILRVVNRNDVVPMLPPRLSRDPNHGSYTHIGEELILLGGSDFVHIGAHDAERVSVAESWRDRRYASLADHRMARYLEVLEARPEVPRQVPFAQWRQSARDLSEPPSVDDAT